MARELTVRDRIREREKARRWFKDLDCRQKDELGNELVLGDFNWRDWFYTKPSSVFLNEVDKERMYWEGEGGPC